MKKLSLIFLALIGLAGCDGSKTDAELPSSASVSMVQTNASTLDLFSFDGLKHEMSLITVDWIWKDGEHSYEFIAVDTEMFEFDFNLSIEDHD